jgi:hypothetical protein
MSYGTELAGVLIDHILRGAKPSDLQVQTPTKYSTSRTRRSVNLGLLIGVKQT